MINRNELLGGLARNDKELFNRILILKEAIGDDDVFQEAIIAVKTYTQRTIANEFVRNIESLKLTQYNNGFITIIHNDEGLVLRIANEDGYNKHELRVKVKGITSFNVGGKLDYFIGDCIKQWCESESNCSVVDCIAEKFNERKFKESTSVTFNIELEIEMCDINVLNLEVRFVDRPSSLREVKNAANTLMGVLSLCINEGVIRKDIRQRSCCGHNFYIDSHILFGAASIIDKNIAEFSTGVKELMSYIKERINNGN